jgi:hypothetical protein
MSCLISVPPTLLTQALATFVNSQQSQKELVDIVLDGYDAECQEIEDAGVLDTATLSKIKNRFIKVPSFSLLFASIMFSAINKLLCLAVVVGF